MKLRRVPSGDQLKPVEVDRCPWCRWAAGRAFVPSASAMTPTTVSVVGCVAEHHVAAVRTPRRHSPRRLPTIASSRIPEPSALTRADPRYAACRSIARRPSGRAACRPATSGCDVELAGKLASHLGARTRRVGRDDQSNPSSVLRTKASRSPCLGKTGTRVSVSGPPTECVRVGLRPARRRSAMMDVPSARVEYHQRRCRRGRTAQANAAVSRRGVPPPPGPAMRSATRAR